jgi:threonine synthase
MVSDDEILKAYKFLADKEGIFVEPASAASVAGLIKMHKQDYFAQQPGACIVCVLTGHGLKDPDRAIKMVREPSIIPAKIDSVLKEAGL